MVLIITDIFSIWGSVLGDDSIVPLAILIYTTGFEMFLFLKSFDLKIKSDQNFKSWILDPEQAPVQAKEIIRYTQENVTASHLRSRFEEIEQNILHKIDRKLIFLNTLVASAPLMGL